MNKLDRFKIFLSIFLLAASACSSMNRHQAMFQIADWYHSMHLITLDQYERSDESGREWLRRNVNPYLNILRQLIICIYAIDSNDLIKASRAISEIAVIGTKFSIDVSKILEAYQRKDFDALLLEAMKLKTFVLSKWEERRG